MIREIQITSWRAITTAISMKSGPDMQMIIGCSVKFNIISTELFPISCKTTFMEDLTLNQIKDKINILFNLV